MSGKYQRRQSQRCVKTAERYEVSPLALRDDHPFTVQNGELVLYKVVLASTIFDSKRFREKQWP